MDIRKTVFVHEIVHAEGRMVAAPPIHRAAGMVVFTNPHAGQQVEDLSALFQLGHDLGVRLMADLPGHLAGPAVSYGKAAIVGVNGDLEHGHALLHPMLGKAMRTPIGGGKAIIPSAAKVGAAGASLDIPLGHKDDVWSFDHFDAMSVCVTDSPRPDEILMAIALADGGRPAPRVGKGRAVT